MVAKILLVEDNNDIREITSLLLANFGYSVTQAINGLEALKILQQSHFDLIITDIFMPGMNGNELIERLAELKTRIPIIALSYNLIDITPNPLICVISTKPLRSENLRNLVGEALHNRWVIN